MKFAYASIIAQAPGESDFLLLRRPEIPVTIVGPGGTATFIGLVDTGSDHTILPYSVASLLGVTIDQLDGPSASVFGGHKVQLLQGNVVFQLTADEGETISWTTPVCFFEFPQNVDEALILGHAGFLDYFTATFDGKEAVLTLIPNDELPE